jgi:Zn-dependent oligopeptidase
MEEFVASTGVELEGGIEPWDWRYYAEQVLDPSMMTLTNSFETVFAIG